ncbi:helix-turn-helix domain-containing protein [Kitasatospora sp. NPDC056800]|uniref:helix-turn-helix domain-containing protein n=1 Tax=Kitasatospora sp. NPDC056800 TaxID=3345948 RepID=UPI0036A874DB
MSSETGALIRHWRLRAGLTQEDLATRSDLSIRTIRDIETGRSRQPYRRSLEQLAAALGLDATTVVALTRRRPGHDLPPDLPGHPRPQTPVPAPQAPSHPTALPHLAAATGPEPAYPATALPRPAQLPPDIAHFTGRQEALRQCDDELLLSPRQRMGRGKVVQLFGAAGAGKSALAVHWAHRVADRFPDGQLYVDLHGRDASEPLRPATVLRSFLRALGIQQSALPESGAELAALYRSTVAGKSLLILLDNARSAEQVRPLLPNSPSCAVVVTARAHLTGLTVKDGARPVGLGRLPDHDAVRLLTSIIGAASVSAAPEALVELVELAERCAGLPLAVRIIGERLAGHPGTVLAHLAEAVETDPLDLFDSPDDPSVGIRTTLSWSYLRLPERSARLFRLLSLHCGPDLSLRAAAEMADAGHTAKALHRLRADLAALVHEHLVESPEPDRYRFPTLVRLYAAERAAAEEPEHEREQSVRRLLAWYGHTSALAAHLVASSTARTPQPRPAPPARALPFSHAQDARAWLARESANLRDAVGAANRQRAFTAAQAIRRSLNTWTGFPPDAATDPDRATLLPRLAAGA